MKKIYYLILLTSILFGCGVAKLEHITSGKIEYSRIIVVTEEAAKRSDSITRTGYKEFVNQINADPNTIIKKSNKLVGLETAIVSDTFNYAVEIHPNYFTSLNLKSKYKRYRYTDRKTKRVCFKKPKDFNTDCGRLTLPKAILTGNYSFTYLKKDRKKIFGYKCYKVIAQDKMSNIKHTMYVTEDINFQYNFLTSFAGLDENLFVMSYRKDIAEGNFRKEMINKIDLK